jgi:hypothetical protein
MPLVQLMQDDPRAAHAFIAMHEKKLDGDFSWLHFTLLARKVDVLLYEGNGRLALEAVQACWPVLSNHPLYSGRLLRACALLLRARASLAAYAETGDEAALEAIPQDSHALRQLGAGFAGTGPLIDAQLACLKGDRSLARARYEEAIHQYSFEQADHGLRYVRYRLGELVGDIVGHASCRDIRAWLEQQGVQNPEHFIRMVVPVSALPKP